MEADFRVPFAVDGVCRQKGLLAVPGSKGKYLGASAT
jgi:hypothetical protein